MLNVHATFFIRKFNTLFLSIYQYIYTYIYLYVLYVGCPLGFGIFSVISFRNVKNHEILLQFLKITSTAIISSQLRWPKRRHYHSYNYIHAHIHTTESCLQASTNTIDHYVSHFGHKTLNSGAYCLISTAKVPPSVHDIWDRNLRISVIHCNYIGTYLYVWV